MRYLTLLMLVVLLTVGLPPGTISAHTHRDSLAETRPFADASRNTRHAFAEPWFTPQSVTSGQEISTEISPKAVAPAGLPPDFDVPSGHFFSQAGSGDGTGYTVSDSDGIRMWSEFKRLGGVASLGYPISQRFSWDGFICQAFQRVIFQWHPDTQSVTFVNVFDRLHDLGKDDWLLSTRQTPKPLTFNEQGMTWEQIVANRLKLLDASPAIKAKYYAVVGDPIQFNGLPTSAVTDMGNAYVLRAQRVVFQQWKEDVPWAKKGEVTVALGGQIAKDASILPDAAALRPVPPPSTGAATNAAESFLARIDTKSWDSTSFRVSSDSRHIAYFAVKPDRTVSVGVDGVVGKAYDNVGPDGPIFSPNSQHVTYAARRGRDEFVVVDGKEGQAYDVVDPESITFSADSQRVAYLAKRGELWMAVVDGKESKPYEDVFLIGFSPDSQHVVFGAAQSGQEFVALDGTAGKLYGSIDESSVTFSRDSQRLAYAATEATSGTPGDSDASLASSRQLVVVNGVEQTPYDGIRSESLLFSPDSSHIAYVATIGSRHAVVLDGVAGPTYDDVSRGTPWFSPNGEHMAYGAREGKQWFLVEGENRGKSYDNIIGASVVFSADSRRMGYVAISGGQAAVVVDGEELGTYDDVWKTGLRFSPDGRRVVYAVQSGEQWHAVVDGKEQEPFDDLGARGVILSPDGSRTAYNGAKRGSWYVVVDGQKSKSYPDVSDYTPVFSPDSKHVVYVAYTDDTGTMTVDGKDSNTFDTLVSGSRVIFDSNTSFHYLILRGYDIYVVSGRAS